MTKQKIRESLNKLDHQALDDCTKYYDLLNLYESLESQLTTEEFKMISSYVNEADSKNIHNYMQSLMNEDFCEEECVVEDEVSEELDESECIYEDKIVPEKCYAKESGKPYYSLKNITDDEYIKYGARTRYNSRSRAAEKLRDLEAHVDGEYIDDSNVIKSEVKDESLNESIYVHFEGDDEANDQEFAKFKDARAAALDSAAKAEIYQINELSGDRNVIWTSEEEAEQHETLNPLKQVSPELKQEIEYMLKNPVNVSGANKGLPKPRIWILIKLYEKTNGGNPTMAVPRSELLVASGTDPKRQNINTQSQTMFEELAGGRYDHGVWKPGDGLLDYAAGKAFRPTNKLAPFIEGNNQFGVDFRKFIGIAQDPEVSGQARNLHPDDNTLKSRAGATYNKTGKPSNIEDSPEDVTTQLDNEKKEAEKKAWADAPAKWSFKAQPQVAEAFEPEVAKIDNSVNIHQQRLNDLRQKKNEEIRKAFRQDANLDEDVEITEEHFGTDNFKLFCWKNGLNWDTAREALLGDKANENK